MANTHSTLTGLFTDIADAIREKTGGNELIVADAFPEAISAIEAGGGLGEPVYVSIKPTAKSQTITIPELVGKNVFMLSITPDTRVISKDGDDIQTLGSLIYVNGACYVTARKPYNNWFETYEHNILCELPAFDSSTGTLTIDETGLYFAHTTSYVLSAYELIIWG